MLSPEDTLRSLDLRAATKARLVSLCRELNLPVSGHGLQVEVRLKAHRSILPCIPGSHADQAITRTTNATAVPFPAAIQAPASSTTTGILHPAGILSPRSHAPPLQAPNTMATLQALTSHTSPPVTANLQVLASPPGQPPCRLL